MDIKLDFVLDDKFLASHMIEKCSKGCFSDSALMSHIKDIVAFQNLAWEISDMYYACIQGRTNLSRMFPLLKSNGYSELGNNLDDYLNKLIESTEYKTVRKQAEDSLEICKTEWSNNYVQTKEFVSSIGIEIKGKYKIWMTHPALRSGAYLGNNNIVWSHQALWPNYSTIYIWHEILHSYFQTDEISHAIIELITDNHLRFLLNKTDYPPFEGHHDLKSIEYQILDSWKLFLKKEKKNIKEFVDSMSKHVLQD